RPPRRPALPTRRSSDLETVTAKLPGDVDFVRVDGYGPGNERDVIEPVRDPGLAPSPDPHPHLSPSRRPSPRQTRHPLHIGIPRSDRKSTPLNSSHQIIS